MAEHADDAPAMDAAAADRLRAASPKAPGQGCSPAVAAGLGQPLPAAFVWWRDFAARYVAALCLHPPASEAAPALPNIKPPDEADLATLVLTAPMMAGAEYLTADVLRALWTALADAASAALKASGASLQDFLKALNPAWNLVGRVHLNLAENRRDPDAPFAFMATYTTQLSAQARAQHLPLGEALRAYASDRDKLLALLLPGCSAPPSAAPGCASWSRRGVAQAAALGTRGGRQPARRRRRPGSRRYRPAHAGRLARRPPGTPARDGNRRQRRAVQAGAKRPAGFLGCRYGGR